MLAVSMENYACIKHKEVFNGIDGGRCVVLKQLLWGGTVKSRELLMSPTLLFFCPILYALKHLLADHIFQRFVLVAGTVFILMHLFDSYYSHFQPRPLFVTSFPIFSSSSLVLKLRNVALIEKQQKSVCYT